MRNKIKEKKMIRKKALDTIVTWNATHSAFFSNFLFHTLVGFSGSAYLPQDVLVHIFSFLDLKSLVSVGLVCW